ncbi:MAG: hypothetical protein P8M19_04790 [Crocinitomicaceae bacterium]|nr:hypothetical protein [Crocinitomicaceae bacterium]MDG1659312.1 hypothetical protein [Crocinitomicaceae bacterium]MDG2440968.1 hypothetical protein [Crocinitomicaceae bacterium]
MKKLLLLGALALSKITYAQEVVSTQVYSNVDDMDGFGSGDSDPQWNYEITDVYGQNSGDNTELGGTNCPFWTMLNDQFFSETYDCEMPASYTFT